MSRALANSDSVGPWTGGLLVWVRPQTRRRNPVPPTVNHEGRGQPQPALMCGFVSIFGPRTHRQGQAEGSEWKRRNTRERWRGRGCWVCGCPHPTWECLLSPLFLHSFVEDFSVRLRCRRLSSSQPSAAGVSFSPRS